MLILILLLLQKGLFAWTSSNQGVCYTMDSLCTLTDSIFSTGDQQYEVHCNIIILSNDTLKLRPGEVIDFIGHWGILIYGCLRAIGTLNFPINLLSTSTIYGCYYWNGIKFINTSPNSKSILRYCKLRRALDEYNEVSIYCENSSPIIDHSRICYVSSDAGTGGAVGVFCGGISYPIISYCTFDTLLNAVAVATGILYYVGGVTYISFEQDTINYPSPLLIGCNIRRVTGVWYPEFSTYSIIINGGFLDNCYVKGDTTLGLPLDTIGDGICTTTSTFYYPCFWKVDGIMHPRSNSSIITIDGYVTYPNSEGTSLNNISITLQREGIFFQNTTTDISGHYNFSVIENSVYKMEATTTKPWGGVTSADVLMYKKHIAGIASLDGIFLSSGDVNGSGTLTAVDVLLIKKRIAGIINTFPAGDWLFNNQPVTINGTSITYDFNGLCYGDANASYIPVSLKK